MTHVVGGVKATRRRHTALLSIAEGSRKLDFALHCEREVYSRQGVRPQL
jgi:hypothetical protein